MTIEVDRLRSELAHGSFRYFVVIEHAAYVGIAAHAAFIPLFYVVGVVPMALVNIASVGAWLWARSVNRRGRQGAAAIAIGVEVIVHSFLAVGYLGWDSGFQFYLLPLIPFVCFNDRASLRVAAFTSAAVVVVFVVEHVLFRDAPTSINPELLELLYYVNVSVPALALFIISFYYRLGSIGTERQLMRLATEDPLTQLFNRRRMLGRLTEEQTLFERHQRSFSLAMVDIDHFKRINDTYGHEAGDRVLVELSGVLKSALRGQDVVSRWGGEEYLVLLPETALPGAEQVAEKLRTSVESHAFEQPPLRDRITITVGVAQFDGGRSIEDCIRAADAALYTGKKRGRNQVVVWRPELTEDALT